MIAIPTIGLARPPGIGTRKISIAVAIFLSSPHTYFHKVASQPHSVGMYYESRCVDKQSLSHLNPQVVYFFTCIRDIIKAVEVLLQLNCKPMKSIQFIAWLLVIIGGLNWGLVGFFQFDLVAEIFGAMSTVARIVYALVGLSALLLLFKKAS